MTKPLKLIVTLILLLLLPASYLAEVGKVQAYDANNIIPDAEFINSNVLDANGVQSFLNTKGGTRLRTFSEGGRSAAQIIADAARVNGISPYVILATIQKEESLVDSNTNFDFRVNWAMGYSICDSCSLDDPNVVANKGFTKQIDNGAWQLKRNYSYWAANGSEWNVGRTMIIDGTAIRFANRATSSLYRYTPHLHGNQNFYDIYNRYKSFFYKADSGKTKTVVDKSTLKSKTGANNQNGDVAYSVQYVTQVVPGNLAPGQKRTIYVYLKNIGTSTWVNSGPNPVYLGNANPQDRESIFTGGNVRWRMLNSSVPPGRVGVFSIQITAPNQSGIYVEKFRSVMEGITWFGDEVTFAFNVGGNSSSK